MFELLNLTTGYGDKAITRNINLRLEQGHLVALLGRNGTGKSTLLRTLCAFQQPLEGKMLIDGSDVTTLNTSQLSRLIGVVLTERPDVPDMTVRDMVAMGRSPYTGFFGRLNEEDEQKVDEAICLTGIEALQQRKINTLSDGERQKAMIAKALAQHTSIILLDEPTAFLDYPSKIETFRLLSRLAQEQQKSILLSTHDVEMALRLCDTVWFMDGEGIIAGTPEELSQNGSLKTFFEASSVSLTL